MSQPLYDRIGVGYSDYRKPDARIAAEITGALGGARGVVNVGAGAGSYEPGDRTVVAVEPSAAMIAQRPPAAGQALRGSADALPLRDGSFDAALAILTIHHWPDWRQGLREMRRVARDRVVLFTWDPGHPGFWLVQEYFPEILEIDHAIMPPLAGIAEVLGAVEVRTVPVPADCSDGFLGAYWRRPAAYLDVGARGAISSFARLADPEPALQRLRADLADGSWERRNQALLALPSLDIGYRLVIARGSGA